MAHERDALLFSSSGQAAMERLPEYYGSRVDASGAIEVVGASGEPLHLDHRVHRQDDQRDAGKPALRADDGLDEPVELVGEERRAAG